MCQERTDWSIYCLTCQPNSFASSLLSTTTNTILSHSHPIPVDKDEELSSRVEELMDKFMDIVVSDPQQRELAEEVEQRKKFIKKNGHVNKRIVTG